MIWWLVAAAVVGVIGVANGILNRLRNTASAERQRWHNEYQKVERTIVYYDQQIQQKIREAQYTVDFHQLTQLHFESMKTADHAYQLLSDSRKALDAIGDAIKSAKDEKDRLIAEKHGTRDYYRRSQLEQEISALISLRTQLFPDKDQLKAQRDHFHTQVKNLNAHTHDLKIAIRDRCGEKGQDWYLRLEDRTTRRQLGLPATTAEVRVRGRIKWYDNNKGYGFVTPSDKSQDVHISRTNLTNTFSLSEGDIVEFSIKYGEKGRWASNITIVGNDRRGGDRGW